MKESSIEFIVQEYFSDPTRQFTLKQGKPLVEQGQFNDRLFYVLKGNLEARINYDDAEGEAQNSLVFNATAKTFLGVYSFFSKKFRSPLTVIATIDTKLAYIDSDVAAINAEEYGSLTQQFMPMIVEELSKRQMRSIESSHMREVALNNLHEHKQLTMLGKMAAGITHELNNVMSVIDRNSYNLVQGYQHKLESELTLWKAFGKGLKFGQTISHKDAREHAQILMKRFPTISYDYAKRLSAMLKGQIPNELADDHKIQLREWEAGRDCYDLRLASTHAVNLLKSIKLLVSAPKEHIVCDLHASLSEAIALVRNIMPDVEMQIELEEVQDILGNPTELIQIWVNILKNAAEAMQIEHVNNPMIKVRLHQYEDKIFVSITNNGPKIPDLIAAQIFLPNFTTKTANENKSSNSKIIGLGLGLSIVKRIIVEHQARILLDSKEGLTKFTILFNAAIVPKASEVVNK
ncbi:sensor histidine kinase [Gammaproteobacteria bacterium]|nr:sensor histidine kinase [Gammaproteobacteria bacterium]